MRPIVSRGCATLPVPIFDWRTPGDGSERAESSRPFSGSARVSAPVVTWPRSAGVGLELRHGAGDSHALGQGADLQGQVHPLSRAHGHTHIVCHGDGDAVLLGRDLLRRQ